MIKVGTKLSENEEAPFDATNICMCVYSFIEKLTECMFFCAKVLKY